MFSATFSMKNKRLIFSWFHRYNPFCVNLPGKCISAAAGAGFCYALVDSQANIDN